MRLKRSFYVFITKLLSTIIPSVLGVILNNLIIRNYGSDLNGVAGTINQFLIFITIFEGGFTLASTVKLYKPYLENNTEEISVILSTTRRIFLRIGIVVLIVSVIASFILPNFIKSDLDKSVISVLMLIASFNICLQFLFSTKYQIMFAASQKEYISGSISIVFGVITQIIMVIMVMRNVNIVLVRSISLVMFFIQLPFIIYVFRKNFPSVSFKSVKTDLSILKSTKDIFSQKVASLVFGSTDLILLSVFVNTKVSSVYAVNMMIFSIIKSLLISFILAPLNAFGQLFVLGEKKKLSDYYMMYQFISIILIGIFLTTTLIMTKPFLLIYTDGVNDVNYVNQVAITLFTFVNFFELISNILGGLTNSIGMFFEMKRIAIGMALINIIISILLVKEFGINGVLIGTFVGYVFAIVFQLRLVYIITLNEKPYFFIKLTFLNVFLSAGLFVLITRFDLTLLNYVDFVIKSGFVFISVSFVYLIVNFLVYRKLSQKTYLTLVSTFRSNNLEHLR